MSALRAGVYPRLATWLLIASTLLMGLLNPLVVSFVVGEVLGETASYYLYEGPGASPNVYASTFADILFNAVVAWLGLTLLWRTAVPALRPRRTGDEGTTSHRFSSFGLRLLWVLVLALGLLPIALVVGLFPGGSPPGLDVAQAEIANPACPPPNQATYGAWASSRLVVHNPCQHVVATVQALEEGEADGDVGIFVTLDPEYATLRGGPQNVANLRRFGLGGELLMELMPRDGQSIDPDTGEIRPAHIPAPSVGDKVDVWGARVFDSGHGYYEIHPVFSMSTSSDGGETWGETYTSGPQYGGTPRGVPRAKNAYARCLDENGNHCVGYYNPGPGAQSGRRGPPSGRGP